MSQNDMGSVGPGTVKLENYADSFNVAAVAKLTVKQINNSSGWKRLISASMC